jgi:hypothetical protein
MSDTETNAWGMTIYTKGNDTNPSAYGQASAMSMQLDSATSSYEWKVDEDMDKCGFVDGILDVPASAWLN